MEYFLNPDWNDLRQLAIVIGSALAILILFLFLGKKAHNLLRARFVKRMNDPLLADFLSGMARILIILVGFMIIFRIVGLTGVVSGLLAGAGISAFIIGFALKDIGENFLAGILLAFKRPFRVGDVVDIAGIRGKVLTLNLRDTQIKTVDGKDVFLPNASIIKNPLVNFTLDGFLRYDFVIGLDYGSDYDSAIELIKQTLTTVKGVLGANRKPNVLVHELAESTLNIQITYWVNTYDSSFSDIEINSNAKLQVLKALEKAGFNLPAKIIEVKNHQGSALKTT